jgi:hypothetical protein
MTPTATQALSLVHETLVRVTPVAPGTAGVGSIDHTAAPAPGANASVPHVAKNPAHQHGATVDPSLKIRTPTFPSSQPYLARPPPREDARATLTMRGSSHGPVESPGACTRLSRVRSLLSGRPRTFWHAADVFTVRWETFAFVPLLNLMARAAWSPPDTADGRRSCFGPSRCRWCLGSVPGGAAGSGHTPGRRTRGG